MFNTSEETGTLYLKNRLNVQWQTATVSSNLWGKKKKKSTIFLFHINSKDLALTVAIIVICGLH